MFSSEHVLIWGAPNFTERKRKLTELCFSGLVLAGDQELSLSGIVPLGGDGDCEVLGEAVKMSHLTQLRHMFAPVV